MIDTTLPTRYIQDMQRTPTVTAKAIAVQHPVVLLLIVLSRLGSVR